MFARTGRKWNEIRPNSKTGILVRQQGVPRSEEFDRIWTLPRRKWAEVEDLPFLQSTMTDWLKTPGGSQVLRPVQATLLAELHDYGAVLAPITVGGGKTLASFLAPTVIDAERPVLILPASLRDKTKIEFKALAKHWRAPFNLMIVSYEQLGRENYVDLFNERAPDLIICDEVHKLRNLQPACTKRVRRWMEANPGTSFVAMSGTITKRSLMDFHHLMLWTLGPKRMPLPFEPSETRRWSLAVDAKVPDERRMAPGILASFIDHPTPDKMPSMEEVRAGLSRRIMETPGVVGSLTDDVDASILLNFYEPDLPSSVIAMMEQIVEDGVSLNGDIVLGPVEWWRHMRELSCGVYYKWKETPPREWMTCRQRWFGFQRKILEQGYDGIDSPLQVTRAVVDGQIDSQGLYLMWRNIKDVFTPETEACWVSTKIVEKVIQESTREPTLIWVEHVAVGEMMAQLSGLRFFNRGGIDQFKTHIEHLDGSESIIVSIASNAEGRNLQKWSRNHVVAPPPGGAIWEQMIGRTHRYGQEADEIGFEVSLGHKFLVSGMAQAFDDARYISGVTGKVQKLLLADKSGIHIN